MNARTATLTSALGFTLIFNQYANAIVPFSEAIPVDTTWRAIGPVVT